MAFFICFEYRCFVDCGAIISASSKLRLTSECSNAPCNGSVYEWHLQKLNDAKNTWEETTILPNMTSTGVNASNMIIKADVLPSSTKFTLRLIVTSQTGSQGLGELQFETAEEPHSGYCSPSVSEGVALETEFTFECFNWEDESKPLSYEFRVGDHPLSYGSSPRSVLTVLSSGKPEDEHKVEIKIIIKNFVGVTVTETLFVKVIILFSIYFFAVYLLSIGLLHGCSGSCTPNRPSLWKPLWMFFVVLISSAANKKEGQLVILLYVKSIREALRRILQKHIVKSVST